MNKSKKTKASNEKEQQPAVKADNNSSAINSLTSFTYNKSDEDVEVFIKTFIIPSKNK